MLVRVTCVSAKSLQSCPTLCNPMDCSLPGSSVCEDYPGSNTREVLCPPPGNLPDPGLNPRFLMSPALGGGSFTTVPPGTFYYPLLKFSFEMQSYRRPIRKNEYRGHILIQLLEQRKAVPSKLKMLDFQREMLLLG